MKNFGLKATYFRRTESLNYAEVLDKNGSVLFATSRTNEDMNLPTARPIVAFSPSADFNGNIIWTFLSSIVGINITFKKL
jgi:hypothetical protein